MSSQHKAPLAAFLVVSIACIVVVVNALRSDAVSSLLASPTQAVIAGARLVPQPQDILSAEAKVVAGATTGLSVAPRVVDAVVDKAVHTVATKPKRQGHHRPARGTAALSMVPGLAAASAATPAVGAPAVAAPPSVTQPAQSGTSSAQQTRSPLKEIHLPSWNAATSSSNAWNNKSSSKQGSQPSVQTQAQQTQVQQSQAQRNQASSRHEGRHRSSRPARSWADNRSNNRSTWSNNGADRSPSWTGKDRSSNSRAGNGWSGSEQRADNGWGSEHRSGWDTGHRSGNGWGNGRYGR